MYRALAAWEIKMVKLLISDVDGTLLRVGESTVSESIKKKLRTFITEGGTVAIASGRTYRSLRLLFGDLADSVYLIPCDGALCIKGERVLYHRPIPTEIIRKAFAAAKENGLCLHLAAATDGYIFGGADFKSKLTEEHTDTAFTASSPTEVREPIYKISFYGKAPNFATVPAELRCSYHGNGWREYVYRFADKGTALSDLQSRLFMTEFDTAAIGDGINDAPMLRNAKYAYALTEELKNAVPRAVSVENINEAFDLIKR